MNHNLQVEGYYPNLSAKCSCGQWSKEDESWDWKDGTQVRNDSWEDFETHVRQHDPNVVKCYQVIGWYSNINPKERNFTNISDGATFSSLELANQYAERHGMAVLQLNPLLLSPDDKRIDYFASQGKADSCSTESPESGRG